MEYMSFKTEHAIKYGLNEAILLNHLMYWVEKNKANDKHFHDDRYWTYNSLTAYEKMFPFITLKNIRTALDHLRALGIVYTGNFNVTGYDRTLWYTVDFDKCKCDFDTYPNAPQANGYALEANRNDATGTPIPYINQDNTQDNTQDTPIKAKRKPKTKIDIENLLAESGHEQDVLDVIEDFMDMRVSIKKPMSYGAVKLLLTAIDSLPDQRPVYIKKALEISILKNYTSVYPIRNERDLPPEEKIAYVEERDPNENISWFDPRFDPNACCRKTSVGTST